VVGLLTASGRTSVAIGNRGGWARDWRWALSSALTCPATITTFAGVEGGRVTGVMRWVAGAVLQGGLIWH
jgi:hypothetical protein